MKDNGKGLGILAVVLMIVGAVVGIGSSIVGKKQQELTIKNQVAEQVKLALEDKN